MMLFESRYAVNALFCGAIDQHTVGVQIVGPNDGQFRRCMESTPKFHAPGEFVDVVHAHLIPLGDPVMPSYVYVLRSAATGQHYIGSTNDLHRRIADYNHYSSRAFKMGDAWECVYVELCDNLDAARTRERYLKSVDGVDEKIRILYSTPSRNQKN